MVDNPPQATRLDRDSYPVDAKVGSNIRSFRTAMGMSLGSMAHETGLRETMLSEFEQGIARPSAENLLAIATYLGVKIADLFSGL